MKKILNYINGELVEPISKSYLDNIEPATGKTYSQLPDSDESDVALAVAAAVAAFPNWSQTTVLHRHNILTDISKCIAERIEDFALAETKDSGKPISLSHSVDIPRSVANFEFFANAITQFSSESHETDQDAINYTLRHPIGVVGCISPWNLPLYLFSWKIAPALAAGNCVVAKPSEFTPMTAFMLSEICREVGLPKGVLNIVHGLGHKVGESIVSHPLVKAISFTGGTLTGSKIASIASPMFKKISLELGGKNANIIFEDCDYESMLNTTLRSSFSNQGQICLCGSRIFVQDTIYEKFKQDFVSKVVSLRLGNPNDKNTQIGAVVSEQHKNKVLTHIQIAKDEGGIILCGGNSVSVEGFEEGYFIEPTVIEGLDSSCRTNQEEIFGPVVTLIPFHDIEEVVQKTNAIRYGLSCSIWTKDIYKVTKLTKEIKTGIVWVNTWLNRDLRTPFGGTKDSGLGREGGWEALKFFTETKNICIKY